MSFTYNPTTHAGKVRLLIGDTVDTAVVGARLEDDEITTILDLEAGTQTPGRSGLYRAAAAAADFLANKLTQHPSVGADKVTALSRSQELRAAANRLRSQANSAAAASSGAVVDVSSAPQYAESPFRKGMHDNVS
jgi:hypothetical protein